jgi:hypothetical protein
MGRLWTDGGFDDERGENATKDGGRPPPFAAVFRRTVAEQFFVAVVANGILAI